MRPMIQSWLSLFGFCILNLLSTLQHPTMLSSHDTSNSSYLIVNNMPTKTFQATDKGVFVTVYVETPRRRASSNRQSHHNHHHYIKTEPIQHKHGGGGKGYNRRAQLLQYSQCLRGSARVRSGSSTPPLQSKPDSSNDQQPSNKIIPVRRRPKYSKTPACFGSWGTLLPSFLVSLMNLQAKKSDKEKKNGGESTSSNYKNMKAVTKRLQVICSGISHFSVFL
ncbi:hypothetical protein PTKIN_Ptkin04bG0218000 [Pterospermum kingtungense]